eukprot:2728531-Pyramimonas_sp.AAC.1
MPAALEKGRWQDSATARIYISEVCWPAMRPELFGAASEGVVKERSWKFRCPLSHALPRPVPFFPLGCWRPSSGLVLVSRGGFLDLKASEGPAS